MRIYCWRFPSQESVPEEYKIHALTFIDNTPEGSLVNCGYCEKEFTLTKDLDSCPYCNKDLIFSRVDW